MEADLEGHLHEITGLDQFSNSKEEKILTVCNDQTGMVWSRAAGANVWNRDSVFLRLTSGATCVQWTRDGSRFAVGSADGLIAVGMLEVESNWWVCKHIKCLEGCPILALSWNPEGSILAVSSVNGKVVFLDGKEETLGKVTAEVEIHCWVHCLAYSPNGQHIALARHDGQISILSTLDFMISSSFISKACLPLRNCVFLDDENLIFSTFCALNPSLASLGESGWQEKCILATKADNQVDSIQGAMEKFKIMESRGENIPLDGIKNLGSGVSGQPLGHQNSVSSIQMVTRTSFSTSSHDGTLILWKLG